MAEIFATTATLFALEVHPPRRSTSCDVACRPLISGALPSAVRAVPEWVGALTATRCYGLTRTRGRAGGAVQATLQDEGSGRAAERFEVRDHRSPRAAEPEGARRARASWARRDGRRRPNLPGTGSAKAAPCSARRSGSASTRHAGDHDRCRDGLGHGRPDRQHPGGQTRNFTVLDADPYDVAPENLDRIGICGTVFEGVPFPLER